MKLTEENLIREEKLGSGSFGVVYSGSYLGTPVAVKVLDKKHHSTLDYNHEIAHEVYILKQLRHPNIVILLGVITSEEQILIVEELVENGTLETWIHTNKKHENPSSISFELKLNWSIEIVRALLYMHEKDVIHRDLKSENILIDKNKVAKICDFGLARKIVKKKLNSNINNNNNNNNINNSPSHSSSSDSDITSSNESLDDKGGLLLSRGVGTLWWRAPEIDTCDHYTNKVDVFSLGIIFAELITHTKGDEIRCSIVKPSKTMDFNISIDMLKDYLNEFALPHCPPEFIQLTIDCCSPDPKERMEMKEVFNRLTGIIKKYDQLAEKINDVINDKELADNFLALLRSSNNPENLIISLDNLISSLSSILSSSDRILNNNDLLALRSLILGNNNNSEEVSAELFVSASNWAKKLTSILDSPFVQPFWNERFIHGFVDKNEAEKMIESSPPGTSIFRFRSPFEAGLVATYVKKSGGRICHRLLASYDNNVASFLQQNKGDIEFIYPNISVDSELLQNIISSSLLSNSGYAMDEYD